MDCKIENTQERINNMMYPKESLSAVFDKFVAAQAPVEALHYPSIFQQTSEFVLPTTMQFGVPSCICYEPATSKDSENHLISVRTPEEAVEHLSLSVDRPGICFGMMHEKPKVVIGKPLSEDGHVLVIGRTGAGKTTAIVNPTMEQGKGYRIFLDVKGELLEHHRRLFGDDPRRRRIVFDPCRDDQGVFYDPFAFVRADPNNEVTLIHSLAKALIPVPVSQEDSPWAKAAISFLTGSLLYFKNLKPKCTFFDVISIINQGSVNEIVAEIRLLGGPAKAYIARLSEMKVESLANIGLDLDGNLPDFTSSEAFRRALSPGSGREELNWDALNEPLQPTLDSVDVFLELREDLLEVLVPLIRVLITNLFHTLSRRKMCTYGPDSLAPVSIVLDEFGLLGKLPALANGLRTLRCYGVTIVLLTQSLVDIDFAYGKDLAQVMIENCSFKVVLGCSDIRSQRYFSELVGTRPVHHSSRGFCWSMGGTSFSVNEQPTREYAIQPHVFATLRDHAVIVSPFGSFVVEKKKAYTGNRVF